MNIKITYKHLDSTPAITEMTELKSQKLKKYFQGKMNLNWNFSVEKQEQIAHCHLTGDHFEFFAEASTSTLYSSIDQVVNHLERQVRKNKEVITNKHFKEKVVA